MIVQGSVRVVENPPVHRRPILRRAMLRLTSLLSGVAVSLWGGVLGAQDFVTTQEAKFQQRLRPFVESYCIDCHGTDSAEADLDLEQTSGYLEMLNERQHWLKVVDRLSSGDMPPEDGEPLSDPDRKQILQLLDELLNQLDCVALSQPGHVTLRRLNRHEYQNTVRDLTGVNYEPASEFPGDDVGYGFDNIGDVLSLPPLLFEKYLAAAEAISQRAILSGGERPFEKTIAGGELSNARRLDGAWGRGGILVTNGTADVAIEFPRTGKYEIRILAFGHQAGGKPVRMALVVDDKTLREVDVKATEKTPEQYTTRVKITEGEHRVGVSFLNDYFNKQAEQGNQDRNLCLVAVEVSGPLGQRRSDLPDSHQRLVFVRPDDTTKVAEASLQVAERLASRAFRRPVTDRESQRLAALIHMVVDDGGSFEEGVQLALQAVLVSPHFLYKVEQPLAEGQDLRKLDEFELASSLSYFLWSSMPDDTLLRNAWEGKLSDPELLRQEVHRMLADPKSEALVQNFAAQWLQLRALDSFEPDPELFPQYTDLLRSAMKLETLMFFGEVMRKDMSLLTLLEADFTFANETLARHYGIEGVRGNQFRRVTLAPNTRGGLLTHGSILTVTSNPTRTSPVKRGKWVLENLLGTPPPPPAPGIMELEDQAQLQGTLREKMQQHRDNPNCASCHARMDPIGFALENFDAIGRWRDLDAGKPIDASGQLPDGKSFRGAIELQRILVLEKRDLFVRCLTEKMLIYSLGRGLQYFDQCTVDTIQDRLVSEDYRFSELVLAIVESPAFQSRSRPKETRGE